MNNIRHRGYTFEEEEEAGHILRDDQDLSKMKGLMSKKSLSISFWGYIVLETIIGLFIAIYLQSSCELGFISVSKDSENDNNSMSIEIMRKVLRDVTGTRDRYVGSPSNEIITPAYIKALLLKYKNNAAPGNLSAEYDEQFVEYGDFNFGSMISIYRNIRNIAFRIHDISNVRGNKAILANCHYDSILGSPGASDNFVNCVFLLEVIRVLLNTQISLKFDIIFLFNGAEENMLQGSHAFVTQHRWWKDVAAAVNLESSGGGGRRLLFQSCRKHPELIGAYARTANRPFATVLAQDIFDANLIPSNTDYSIFTDLGRVPGVDLAYIANGYVYHTAKDSEELISPSCLRNEGNNMLNYLIELANLETIKDSGALGHNNFLIYFDFLGFFILQYSWYVSVFINITVVASTGIFIITRVIRMRKYGVYILFAFINHLLCIAGMSFCALSQANLFTSMGRSMSWYCRRLNIFGIYILPVLTYYSLHHTLTSKLRIIWPASEVTNRAHFDAALIIFSGVLSLFTFFKIASGYIFLLWIFFPLLGTFIHSKLKAKLDFQSCFQISTLSIPYISHMYISYTVIDVFIPIFGRDGQHSTPEYMLVILLLAACIPFLLFIAGNFYETSRRHLRSINVFLLITTVFYTGFILKTNLGFPYCEDAESPRKQRLEVVHVNRIFNTHTGSLDYKDSGLWLLPTDVNKFEFLKKEILNIEEMNLASCQKLEPYCGFPFLDPGHEKDVSYYLPVKAHNLEPSPYFKILSVKKLHNLKFNVTLEFDGPSHTHLYIMSNSNVQITKWSLSASLYPASVDYDRFDSIKFHYFLYHSYGKRPQQPHVIWMCVDSLPHVKNPEIKVALSAHYAHGDKFLTSELTEFVARLPSWVIPTYWSATYKRVIVKLHDTSS